MAYALLIIEEAIPFTYWKVKIKFRVQDVKGCYDGRDKLPSQERYFRIDRIAQEK